MAEAWSTGPRRQWAGYLMEVALESYLRDRQETLDRANGAEGAFRF
jgi:hypothetical protein